MLAIGFVSHDLLSVSSGFCLGLVLKIADLALDLGDALVRVENLAIDSIQFAQQFLSSSVQVIFHGRIS